MAQKQMVALETFGVALDARPIEYVRRNVQNKRTGDFKEIDIHELPPVDEGSDGVWHVIKEGQKLPANHPVVKAKPGKFEPVED